MEERIDPGKTGKQKSNITRFRRDKRLMVAGGLRSLALLGMLATVIFAIFQYREELNPDNLRRLISYLQAASRTVNPFTQYQFESGLKTVYAPLGEGLVVSSGDTYSFVSGLGDASYSIQLGYSNPAICTSDKYALIYDRGAGGFCVANGFAEYLNGQLSSPILSASMNRNGAFTLVTNETGCRSAVTVYSARQKLLCKWLSTQYYVLHTSINPETSYFGAVCLGQEGLRAYTRLLYFRIGEEEAAWTAELGEKQVYSLTHDKSGGLVILCDDGVYRYDQQGTLTASRLFSLPVGRFSIQEEGELLISFDHTDRSSRNTEGLLLGEALEPIWQGSFAGLPRAVSCRSGCAAFLMSGQLELIQYGDAVPVASALPSDAARDVVVDDDGSPILFYIDRAERVRLEEEAP